jgi:hypothetical protein
VYTIYFNFPVDDACVEIASIGEWQDPGVITAYGDPPLGPNAVSVWTGRRETGAYDMTFQLLVVKIAATL